MATPQASAEHYRAQQRLTVATLVAVRAAWQAMTPDFDVAWRRVLPRLMVLLSAAQLSAARSAAAYVPAVLEERGIEAPPAGPLVPQSLMGVSSDGRPLDSLLRGAVVAAKSAVASGAEPVQALQTGGRWLDMATRTQLADADRVAVQTVIASRAALGGYVRMVNLPSCGRCIVLAGKWFRWNEGFDRHPGCDCSHIPAQEDNADEVATDPRRAFESMSAEEQDKALTNAGAEAVRLGADVSQVVNARRGMKSTVLHRREALVTTEGTTRRGVYGGSEAAAAGGFTQTRVGRRGYIRNQVERRSRRARLMPETILQIADGDRAEAIRLLRLYGYLA